MGKLCLGSAVVCVRGIDFSESVLWANIFDKNYKAILSLIEDRPFKHPHKSKGDNFLSIFELLD